MKERFSTALHSGRTQMNRSNYRQLLRCIICALLINFIVELFARRSLADAFHFLLSSPAAFLYGTLIVLFSLSISFFPRKHDFWFLLICAIWIGLSVTDFILLSYRSMPLTASDIWLMSSVRDIFEKYLSHAQLFALMLGISALLCCVFLLWKIAKKHPLIHWFAFSHTFLLGAVLFIATILLSGHHLIDLPHEFQSLPQAYRDNGFVYAFSTSLVTGGVDEPEDYSNKSVRQVLAEQQSLPKTDTNFPNIIMLQMESFFDPHYVDGLTLSENPIPNFMKLKENWPSGLLSVPCIGAGTANTEFEVLTGMNLTYFGVGEYPYQTIASEEPVESLASTLRNIGYRAHAIHNNGATFYDRNIVFDNFGFETYTSIEYMADAELNPIGWCKDSALQEEIMNALYSTTEQDFVFTVSVQPHGKYPGMPLENAPMISVEGWDDEERTNRFSYYLGQLKESDAFLGSLTKELASYKEPTIVVIYGDHLPSFNFAQEELNFGNQQTTEYAIWANFPLRNGKRDLQTYQLGAYVTELCNIHEGAIFRHHQVNGYPVEEDSTYQNDLMTLEYDMLYGDHFSVPINTCLKTTPLRFDVEDVSISGLTWSAGENNTCTIHGMNFTPYSRVIIGNTIFQTEYISPEMLLVTELTFDEGDALCVAQVSASNELVILSTSAPYVLNEQDLENNQNEQIDE